MSRGRRRPCRVRDGRGSAVVDVVLVLVILVPLVLGILQIALVLFVRNTAAAAASEGARYAATADRDGTDGVRRTRELLRGVVASRFAEQVSFRRVLVDGAPAAEIVVHLSIPALGLGGPAFTTDVVGHAVEQAP